MLRSFSLRFRSSNNKNASFSSSDELPSMLVYISGGHLNLEIKFQKWCTYTQFQGSLMIYDVTMSKLLVLRGLDNWRHFWLQKIDFFDLIFKKKEIENGR